MLDPAIFKAEEARLNIKLPDEGAAIIARKMGGMPVAGHVKKVWLAMDTVCIDIETVGGVISIFPEFKDEYQIWEVK
jgi:hypothetical protein